MVKRKIKKAKPTDSKKGKRLSAKPKPKTKSGVIRGAQGFKVGARIRKTQEEEYQRRKEMPFRFRLKPGDEAEVVILDNEEPFFLWEHTVKTPQGRWENEVCIADTGEPCPLCEREGKTGSYTMMLTVLDRRPYKIQKGPNAGKVIKFSKKLMPVKGRNLPKFERQYNKYKGSWRGLRVACHRNTDKESAIGEDLEFLGKVPEAKLAKFKDAAQPVDYEKLFPIPTAEDLSLRYGVDKGDVVGSEEFDDDADLDDVAW